MQFSDTPAVAVALAREFPCRRLLLSDCASKMKFSSVWLEDLGGSWPKLLALAIL